MNTTTFRALVGLGLGLLQACLSSEAERRGLLAECTFNDECVQPLLCAARRCRIPCRTDRDCDNNWRCLSAGEVNKFVCYAPDDLETACVWPSHCLRGRICARDRVCRTQCRNHYDCQTLRRDLACNIAAGVCEGHPFLDDAGVLRDVLRNDPDANVDPVVASHPIADAGVDGDAVTPGDAGATPCAVPSAPWACTPGSMGCDVADVSFSGNGSCALFTDGTVRCWSSPQPGGRYLGNGTMAGCGAPGLVRDLTGVQSIHQGAGMTCVVRAGQPRPVWCWGSNYVSQLGRDGADALVPEATSIPQGTLVLGGGSGFSITAPGVATVWGGNMWGQLGDGTRVPAAMTPTGVAPHEVRILGLQQLSLAGGTACGVFTGGGVRCWGRGNAGQLGAGGIPAHPNNFSLTPVTVDGITNASEVRLDGNAVCARRSDMTVWCWGYELFPTGRGRVNFAPRQVLDRATQLVMGGASCALRDDGTVWCWTYDPINDERASTIRLVQVPGLTGVRRIFSGATTTCAWLGGADLRCWGYELGDAQRASVDAMGNTTLAAHIPW